MKIMTKELKKEIEQIMKSQSLTCDFDKFINKANWYSLSLCQPLSEEFILFFHNNINWYNFHQNKQISEEIKYKFINI